jgi:hypothetical protein
LVSKIVFYKDQTTFRWNFQDAFSIHLGTKAHAFQVLIYFLNIVLTP